MEKLESSDSGLAYPLSGHSRLAAPSTAAQSEQQKAIRILLPHHDDSIFAYLRFDRSLDQNSTSHGSLSSDQVLAVRALRHCDDDEIRTWLSQARGFSSVSEQTHPSPGDALQEPGFSHLSPSEQVEGFHSNTLNAPGVHAHQTLHDTKPTQETTKAANHYWCTICENAKSYKKSSDWKKHERGHVRTYVCMHRGPLEETEGGHICKLCGLINPSKGHLDGHKVDTCGQGVPGSFANKRRANLVVHLMECHNVQGKAQAQAIADKWQAKTQEQAWSCGFCAHLVYNFEERLKHIALHFDHGQTLDEWDATKVMKGLLSQRSMDSAWKIQLSASSLDLLHPGISWEKHLIKDIQHDLEMGPSDSKPAEVLAKAAYQASQFRGQSIINEQPFAFATVNGLQRPRAVVSSSCYHSITEQDPLPNSNHALSQYLANPTEALYHDDFALDGTFSASSPAGGNDLTEPSSVADQHTNFNGHQEHISATTDNQSYLTPLELGDGMDIDDLWA